MLTAIVQKLLKDVRTPKTPVMLLCDEAAQLHDPPIIRNSMAILRGYGVKLLSVYQDVPQAKLVLGDRFESFAANAGAMLTLQAQDVTTASFFSDRSGERNADVLSYSSPVDQLTGIPQGGNLSFSQDKLPGILPQRIINMDQGYAVLFTHKTKGTVRCHLPDPSAMAGFEHIANRTAA
jgi:type IV secretion system protein VirD4